MQDRYLAGIDESLLQRAAGPYIGVKTGKSQIEYNNPASHSKADTLSLRPPARSRKDRRTCLGELHIGAALVQPEPAIGDG
jgi:hypothetical protein